MSKPKWSANAFARRVQMGEHDIWVIVEGRDHDRPHYDKLLKKLPSTRGLRAQIRLAEQVELRGTRAGGKQQALALHDHLSARRKLTQANRERTARIVFMVDRDRDDFSSSLSSSPHVMYTVGTDVEADILLNCDVWSAVRTAYGIDTRLAKRVKRRVPDPARGLASLWTDWLRLGLAALDCGTPGCAPWSQLSRVNDSNFGPVNAANIHATESSILAVSPSDYATSNRRAVRHVAQRGELLLKGRWIARYIQYLVALHLAGEVVRSVQADVVIDTALARVNYTAHWTSEYETRFSSLLATA